MAWSTITSAARRLWSGSSVERYLYDCVTFFNEREILEFRLDYLKDIVDYFVIVEADQTYSGRPKAQNFCSEWVPDDVKDRIRYACISFPQNLPDPAWVSGVSEDSRLAWKRENYQRAGLIEGLYDANSEDLVLVSDVDEIPDRDRLRELKTRSRLPNLAPVIALEMSVFYYDIHGLASYADGRPFRWRRPKLTTRKYLECTNRIRLAPPDSTVSDAGWHFTYFGGVDRVRTKLGAYAHTEAATAEHLAAVPERVRGRRDVVGRDEFAYTDTYDASKLPRLIFSEKYRPFFDGQR